MDLKPVSNVHPLKPQHGIFTPSLRKRLEDGIRPHAPNPEPVVDTVEQMLCVFFVEVARKTAIALGKKLSKVMSGK